ncbi:transcriptional regulator, TetR family [Amphibacillus marinus]|uniref:Transcriptional regulator, TetR family n=1 Tax=Amphibacillus marinus TaxID=872970 RepID=A0A1H8NSA6_9BACI|nr:TetR/AcrR family transcriptional regulator [Amphibacillus marinus]SEO32449.1 transcriptional regulator, TetR family [Amphibacillus marinus]
MERAEKKHLIRENIIKALFDLLSEKKWGDLSSNEICTRADISKRTLYVYFRSQDEMYLAIVKRSFESLMGDMSKAFSIGRTAKEKLVNLGQAYLYFMIDNPIKGSLIVGYDEMNYVVNYPEQVESIQAIANNFELMTIFQKLDLDPIIFNQHLAIFLWGHLQGIAQLINSKGEWLADYYGLTMEAMIDAQIKLASDLLEGVEK